MSRIECKASFTVDDEDRIEGLASVFGTVDRGGDIVHKGAFSGASFPLPMLAGHDQAERLPQPERRGRHAGEPCGLGHLVMYRLIGTHGANPRFSCYRRYTIHAVPAHKTARCILAEKM